MHYSDQEIIKAFNMINSRARGYFWTLEELAILTGLVGLKALPTKQRSKVYKTTPVRKCELRVDNRRTPV